MLLWGRSLRASIRHCSSRAHAPATSNTFQRFLSSARLCSAPPRPPHHRVVVTGIGLVTSLGNTREKTWTSMLSGRTGISPIESFSTAELPIKIAASVKNLETPASLDPKTPAFIKYAVVAADEALADAGVVPSAVPEKELTQVGVSVGVGIPHLDSITDAHDLLAPPAKVRRVSPYTVPRMLTNMAAGAISIRHQLQGPNLAPATACAAGAHALAEGFRVIQRSEAKMMVVGGAEAAVHPIAIAGFSRARALSKEPAKPFDKSRSGFSIGEGAGILVLEELNHAIRRGASIYAEVRGVGLSGDGWHVTSPHPDGKGAKNAMTSAIEQGGLEVKDINYVSAHATGTPVGDRVESLMLQDLFRKVDDDCRPMVSSIKGAIGHLLGAAGAVEAAITCLSLKRGVVTPTVGLKDVDQDGFWRAEQYVPGKPTNRNILAAVSNSFGFGGTNVSILLTRCFSERCGEEVV